MSLILENLLTVEKMVTLLSQVYCSSAVVYRMFFDVYMIVHLLDCLTNLGSPGHTLVNGKKSLVSHVTVSLL